MLMASGRWRVFIAAAAAALALVGATAAIFRTQSMDRFHIQGPARPGSRTCRSESDRDVLSHRLYEFARARPRLCRRHVGPLAYDLLPLTFAAVALLVGAGCDGFRPAAGAAGVLDPGFAACAWDLSPARTGADRAGLRRLSGQQAARLARDRPWGPRGTRSFKGWSFRGLRLRPGPCRAHPPSYMRLTVAISRAFDRLGVWIGAPSGPSQPAAKRRI